MHLFDLIERKSPIVFSDVPSQCKWLWNKIFMEKSEDVDLEARETSARNDDQPLLAIWRYDALYMNTITSKGENFPIFTNTFQRTSLDLSQWTNTDVILRKQGFRWLKKGQPSRWFTRRRFTIRVIFPINMHSNDTQQTNSWIERVHSSSYLSFLFTYIRNYSVMVFPKSDKPRCIHALPRPLKNASRLDLIALYFRRNNRISF